jgi:hypothetical protein
VECDRYELEAGTVFPSLLTDSNRAYILIAINFILAVKSSQVMIMSKWIEFPSSDDHVKMD